MGAQLLHVTDWRGRVRGAGGGGARCSSRSRPWPCPETLPPERRHGGGLAATRRAFADLLSDRRFVGYVLSCGLVFAAMFAYIAGSPFVLQEIHGLSATEFSLVFGANAAGIMAMSAVSGRLVGRAGPPRLLAAGLAVQAVGALVLLVSVLAETAWPGVLIGLFLVVASVGLVFPNASALAMADHPDRAGSASALLGLCQFVFGAVAAPLVGVAGTGTAVPMAVVIAVSAGAAVLAYVTLAGRGGVPVESRVRARALRTATARLLPRARRALVAAGTSGAKEPKAPATPGADRAPTTTPASGTSDTDEAGGQGQERSSRAGSKSHKKPRPKKPAIVLDIDDTSLSLYACAEGARLRGRLAVRRPGPTSRRSARCARSTTGRARRRWRCSSSPAARSRCGP